MKTNSIKRQIFSLQLTICLSFFALTMPIPVLTSHFLNTHWHGINQHTLLLVSLGLYPIGGFISTPILGIISDKFGRRNTLITCLLLSFLAQLATAVAVKLSSIGMILILRFVAGAFEGNSAIAYASIADLFPSEQRKKYFGKINAAVTLGWIFGPVTGGLLTISWLHHYQYSFPFFVSALLHAIALGIIYRYFNETKKVLN